GFPPREFRLWIALHECTHRAQFTGVPWMREYFLGLVREAVSMVDPDPNRVLETLKGALSSARGGGPGLEGGGRLARRRSRGQRPRAPAGIARAARRAEQDRRADAPPRGPRRRHHGPGRRRSCAVGRALLARAARAAPIGGRRRQAAAAVARHRGEAGPVRGG